MVNRLFKSIANADTIGSLKPVIEWKDDLSRSLTVVNVVTWDRAGLFYKLAGAFSVAGLSILGSKVISRSDHIAIDTFYVVEPDRGVVQSANAQDIFAKTIETTLVANRDLYPDIVAQAKRVASTRPFSAGGEGLHTSFPPTVEVYHELSMERTIVEIQARDQIGLLYRFAKTIWPTTASTLRSPASAPSAASRSTPSTSRAPNRRNQSTTSASTPCATRSPRSSSPSWAHRGQEGGDFGLRIPETG